ncbi:MAG: hypothetical protein AAF715_31185 [Myxococcota bacterium]
MMTVSTGELPDVDTLRMTAGYSAGSKIDEKHYDFVHPSKPTPSSPGYFKYRTPDLSSRLLYAFPIGKKGHIFSAMKRGAPKFTVLDLFTKDKNGPRGFSIVAYRFVNKNPVGSVGLRVATSRGSGAPARESLKIPQGVFSVVLKGGTQPDKDDSADHSLWFELEEGLNGKKFLLLNACRYYGFNRPEGDEG